MNATFSAFRLPLRETWAAGERRGAGDGVIFLELSLRSEAWRDLGGAIERTMTVWRGQLRYRVVLGESSYISEERQPGVVSVDESLA